MIKYLKHNEIDKIKWDRCIENSINGIIYAYSWYLDTVCEQWEALVDGDYQSVFPLTAGRKYRINYLYQPPFAQQLGLFSIHSISEDMVNQFIETIPAKYKFKEINLNTCNTKEHIHYTQKKNITLELDLNNAYEHIYKNYSNNAKRNIKRAIRNDARIKKKTYSEEIIKIFRNNRGKLFSHLKNKQYAICRNIIDLCIEKEIGQSWGVTTKENDLCAGAFFIESNNKVIFLFLATNEVAKKIGAASFLIDRYIEENSGRNVIFDFEGSNDPDLARFYKSFGSKEKIYLHIRKNNLPWFIKWIKG
ncbi:MAG: hypothetical protein FVQ77_11125 [Cytophagales bacterium]|nr:hypothetical protein [Cytophagales bacterium]